MDEIQKTFTLQWIGPFRSLQEMDKHFQLGENDLVCHKSIFSFYYFRGNKKGRGFVKTRFYNYVGIHRKYDISTRLNKNHEHYKNFKENENMRIWIGAFANPADQTPQNTEDVETVLISTYQPTENDKKKKCIPKNSMCIINLGYKIDETPWKKKHESVRNLNDVLIFEKRGEEYRYLVGKLSEIK